MYPFYLPGSVLIFFASTLGIPWLFHKLVTTITRYLNEIPVKASNEEKWRLQVFMSLNSCAALYYDFNYRWRYYKIIMLVQKLMIVAIFIFGEAQPLILVVGLVFSQMAFAVLSVFNRPYCYTMINILSTTCLLVNGLNAMVAFLVTLGVPIPYYGAWLIVGGNIVLPVSVIVLGVGVELLEAGRLRAKMNTAFSKIISPDDARRSTPSLAITKLIGSMDNKKKLEQVRATFSCLLCLSGHFSSSSPYFTACCTLSPILSASVSGLRVT